MPQIDLEPQESRRIVAALANSSSRPILQFNKACIRVLKKRGIDNAAPPFEMVLDGQTRLNYHLA